MDCRKALWIWVGLGICVTGCTHRQVVPETPEPLPPGTQVHKSEELPPRNPRASTCVALGDLSARESVHENRPAEQRKQLKEQARAAYEKALELDPNYLPAHLSLARLYTTWGEEDRAITVYEKALKTHPKEKDLWYEMGMCRCRKRQWEQAAQDLAHARDLDPDNNQIVNALGFCLASTGRIEESLACFQTLNPPARAHYNVARMLYQRKQDDLCRQHLSAALTLDPTLEPAQQMMASLNGAKSADGGIQQVGHQEPVQTPPQQVGSVKVIPDYPN